MGSVGTIEPKSYVGKSVTDLARAVQRKGEESYKDLYDRMRKDFNIPDASDRQLDTLRAVINGIDGYDRSYGDEKTPYNITYYHIEQIGDYSEEERARRKRLGLRTTKSPISISISTEPNTESAYLRMVDAKTHSGIIGANGGLYTYGTGKSSRKINLSRFDVAYGKRR